MASKIKLLPGMELPLTFGFNAFGAYFMNLDGKPLFDPTAYSGPVSDKPYRGDDSYHIPEPIQWNTRDRRIYHSQETTYSSATELDTKYSASIEASYSGLIWNGSAKGSVSVSQNLQFESSYSYSFSQGFGELYEISHGPSTDEFLPVNKVFAEAVNALKVSPQSEEDWNAYFAIFETFGTHYFKSGAIGGYFAMITSIKDELMRSRNEEEIATEISAGFNYMVKQGEMNAELAYKGSKFLEEHSHEVTFDFTFEGGKYTKNIEEFFESLTGDYQPAILIDGGPAKANRAPKASDLAAAKFGAVSDVAAAIVEDRSSAEAVKESMIAALRQWAFLKQHEASGIVARPRIIPPEADYQTISDTFIVANATAEIYQEGARGGLTLAAGPGVTPQSVYAITSCHYYPRHSELLATNSCSMPVTGKQKVLIRATDPHDVTPTAYCWEFMQGTEWISLVGEPSGGDWVSSGNPATAGQDGFLIASIDCSEASGATDGSRGCIAGGVQEPDGQMLYNLTACAHRWESDDRRLPRASLTMPLIKGKKYYIETKTTSEDPRFSLYCVQLTKNVRFSREIGVQNVLPNVEFKAEEDSILFGMLTGPDVSKVRLQSHGAAKVFFDQDLYGPMPIASASVESGRAIPHTDKLAFYIFNNALCCPVPKNVSCRVQVKPKESLDRGSIKASFWRIALEPVPPWEW